MSGLKPSVIVIVGKSNSGKTTLIEGLIPKLVKKGYLVATVKRAKHGFEMDREGKDSFKHREAGAKAVAVVSDDRLALIKEIEGEPALTDIISAYFGGFDLVIVEGFKEEAYPKLVVLRGLEGERELLKLSNILAVVSDEPDNAGLIRFTSRESEKIASFIEREIIAAK